MPLVNFHLEITDMPSLLIFFILQGFMAVSTFQYWRLRTLKHDYNLKIYIDDVEYPSQPEQKKEV